MTIFKNNNLNKIYISESVRSLASQMIQIFIPIYLLVNGYSFAQIVSFLIISSVVHIILAVPSGYLGSRIGYKYLILLSIPCSIIFYISLKNVSSLPLYIFYLAATKEIGGIFYWVGRHSLMGFYTDKDKMGTQLGIYNILTSVAQLPATLIGGIILATLGISPLVIIVAILLFLSMLPLISIKENWTDKDFSVIRLFSKLHIKNTPMFMTEGIENVLLYDLVWPVYLYFYISIKYIALGFVNFLTSITSLLSNFFIGKLSDKNYKLTLRIGAISTFFIWLARIFIKTPLQVYAVDSVSGITEEFTQIPFGAMSYKVARENNFLQLIVFREMAIHAGKLLALFVILALGSFKYALFLGLLYSLGFLLFKFYERTRS